MAPHDTSKTQPVTKFKCSTITASVWRNEGGKGPFYNVTITRSYKRVEALGLV